ncbi:MAG: ribonuclease D [Nocardioides sp.]
MMPPTSHSPQPDPEPREKQAPEPAPEQATPAAPLLTLRDGLPEVVDTAAGLDRACRALREASGPVSIDAERASGYRYTSRAYLVQLRREGAGTALIDPTAFDSLEPLIAALDGTEWVLHAATQDLPCLADLGLRPTALFDTELAGRLLGYPRVGLATLVEELLGRRMRKEHSAVDWSTRPLPEPWLEYAALDVEVLLELREALSARLAETGKREWARQEFEALLTFEPSTRPEPWRRTSGAHRLRGRRASAAVRALWEARDRIARDRDVPRAASSRTRRSWPPPPRCRATSPPCWPSPASTAEAPAAGPGMGGRHRRGPPPPRAAAARAGGGTRRPAGQGLGRQDPVAARRLVVARERLAALSETLAVPAENLLTPDHLRRVLWTPPTPASRRPCAGRSRRCSVIWARGPGRSTRRPASSPTR